MKQLIHARTAVYNVNYHFVMMKGISARKILLEFPEVTAKLWRGHLWSPATYTETIGHISEETVLKYIADQKSK